MKTCLKTRESGTCLQFQHSAGGWEDQKFKYISDYIGSLNIETLAQKEKKVMCKFYRALFIVAKR